MSYSTYAYLTDKRKIVKLYGSADKDTFEELKSTYKNKLDSLNASFYMALDTNKNSYSVLWDILTKKISYPEISYIYGYVYEIICDYYGQLIYNNETIYELGEQNTFIPVPLAKDFPYIVCVDTEDLHRFRNQIVANISEANSDESEDLEYILNEAIRKQKDLAVFTY